MITGAWAVNAGQGGPQPPRQRWPNVPGTRSIAKMDQRHGAVPAAVAEMVDRQPRGERQLRWAGRRVIWIDVDYLLYRTRVELDGRLGHQGEGRFRDRRRDNRSIVGRIWSLRYGFAETFGSPCDVAAGVAIVLSDRGWTGTPRSCGPRCTLRDGLPELFTWAAS